MDRPAKRARLLSDDESDSGASVKVEDALEKRPLTNGFKVNEDYARRFEHNKKREEQHRLEEKYGKSTKVKDEDDADEGDSEDSEEDESEDDDAELATKDVDEEIFATLDAIRNKDARVYDPSVKFYREFELEEEGEDSTAVKKEKPMYLQDYHRQNLLNGHEGEVEDADVPMTYQQEQDAMRRELVGSMHASAATKKEPGSDEDEDDFLVAKSKPKHNDIPTEARQQVVQITNEDVAAADKDPETYLSNFMAARAWVPSENAKWQPFEDSDDSDDEKRAEEFEEAYNMRFENPEAANEKLLSFARDVGKYSVRREDKKSSRQRARDREREKRDAVKREREEGKARLRKLKIEEAEEKVKKIKHAAGMRGKEIDVEAWKDVIEGDFDDDRWEKEMKRRFGEEYYAAHEDADGSDDEEGEVVKEAKSRKIKKPKWDDDIDIKDLVPEFEDEEKAKPAFTLSSEDDGENSDGGVALETADVASKKKSNPKRDRAKAKADAKRTARRERMQIESLVDNSLPVEAAPTNPGFRYRETSPTSFGLSAKDILFADDAQLNSYAGLKKLTGWREQDKKKRDKKKYSKKQRLREWRKEVFGSADGPSFEVGKPNGVVSTSEGAANGGGESGVRDGERKKKRKRSKKTGTVEVKA